MLRRKLIAGFLCRFVLVYGLLIAPWPGWNEAYGTYFRALGQTAFGGQRGQRLLRFEPCELRRGSAIITTQIVIANRAHLDPTGSGPAKVLGIDSRGVGWVPTAWTLALILATPIRWRQRGWAVFWGLLGVHGFILFSVAVYVWNRSTELSLLTLTPFWKAGAEGLEKTLVTQMGAGFAVPVLIWILVTFRQDAWPFAFQPAGNHMEDKSSIA